MFRKALFILAVLVLTTIYVSTPVISSLAGDDSNPYPCPKYEYNGSLHRAFLSTGDAYALPGFCETYQEGMQIGMTWEMAVRYEQYTNTYVVLRGNASGRLVVDNCQTYENASGVFCDVVAYTRHEASEGPEYSLTVGDDGLSYPIYWLKLSWPNAKIYAVPVWRTDEGTFVLWGDLVLAELVIVEN